MASYLHLLFLFSILLCSSNCLNSNTQSSFRPRALVLPVTKDASTLQYITTVKQGTPLATYSVLVDLGGQFLWVDCNQYHESSSYSPARCGSAQCSLVGAKSCMSCVVDTPIIGCSNNTCTLDAYNPVTTYKTFGAVSQDVFSIESTNGKTPGRVVSDKRFLFTCGHTYIIGGLPSGVQGVLGLGREPVGVPSRLAAAFSFNRKFAICLSGSIRGRGVIFFGNEPYTMLPNVDISTSLTHTPLLINPVNTRIQSPYQPSKKSFEYFIGIKSIKVNTKPISLNTTLLSIRSNGYGGTKISTVDPYTVLETSIYNALTAAFVREANLRRVASVAPFGFCFDSKNVASTRVGPGVPIIDLVLQSGSVYWRIFGANSMVHVTENVMCLGFVDGGSEPWTSIVIGSHQLEDNLLQFDIATSRLGFTSSLLSRQTTCANFNFTSTT